jgi:antitoxin (DNA-binding transcriptional repressor) of toxin-antitoxin stability system
MVTLDIEVARRKLPERVAAARRGEVTLITNRGQPYAAPVPVHMLDAERPPPFSLLAPRGSAVGLWGRRPARTVKMLRREWPE